MCAKQAKSIHARRIGQQTDRMCNATHAPTHSGEQLAAAAQPPHRLIDTKEAMRQSGMCRTFVLTDPSFPKPVKVGRATRFVETEVQAWIEARIAARV